MIATDRARLGRGERRALAGEAGADDQDVVCRHRGAGLYTARDSGCDLRRSAAPGRAQRSARYGPRAGAARRRGRGRTCSTVTTPRRRAVARRRPCSAPSLAQRLGAARQRARAGVVGATPQRRRRRRRLDHVADASTTPATARRTAPSTALAAATRPRKRPRPASTTGNQASGSAGRTRPGPARRRCRPGIADRLAVHDVGDRDPLEALGERGSARPRRAPPGRRNQPSSAEPDARRSRRRATRRQSPKPISA